MANDRPWLMVIDTQEAFEHADSDWAVPGYSELVDGIERLVSAFGDRVVLTRFVGSDDLVGSWIPYYQRWPRMAVPDGESMWNLTVAASESARVLTRSTFSKWDNQLAALVPSTSPLYVCGVATESCVLSTAIAAADAGRSVFLITDACRGSSEELHVAALTVMESYAPMIQLVDLQSVASAYRPHRS